MSLLGAGTVAVIAELIGEVGKVIVQAFQNNDPATLEKVTDVLPDGHPLKLKSKLAHEEEVTRRALEEQE